MEDYLQYEWTRNGASDMVVRSCPELLVLWTLSTRAAFLNFQSPLTDEGLNQCFALDGVFIVVGMPLNLNEVDEQRRLFGSRLILEQSMSINHVHLI